MRIPPRIAFAVLLAATLAVLLRPNIVAQGGVSSRTYSLAAGFDQGYLVNLQPSTMANGLVINETPVPLPFVNVALTGRGTLIRINVNPPAPGFGPVPVGEYKTAPSAALISGTIKPSSVAVDRFGNAWVANRGDALTAAGTDRTGSIARVGVVIGTRAGDYVLPPFTYNTCQDRDYDGRIRTSGGANQILPWTDAGPTDECIINYIRVAGAGPRALAIDADNNLWVGGADDHEHEKIDGLTGMVVPSTRLPLTAGGLAAVIDFSGNVWSAGAGPGGDLLRFDPTLVGTPGYVPESISVEATAGDVGLALDPRTGSVWRTRAQGPAPNSVTEIRRDGTQQSYSPPFVPHGITVDGRGHVWVAEAGGRNVWHLEPVAGGYSPAPTITVPMGGTVLTGLSVDANGQIWFVNRGGTVARITPTGTVTLPATFVGGVPAAPESFGDMTGLAALAAHPSGTWSLVHEGAGNGTIWGTVRWNAVEPAQTSIRVEVRAADTQAGLSRQTFEHVENGKKFNGIAGRFLEVRTTLARAARAESPVLIDLTVSENHAPIALCHDLDIPNDPGQCGVAAVSSVDNGSHDPDNEPITVTETPTGGLAVGIKRRVSLTAVDGSRASASCNATVRVVDVERPSIECPAPAVVECVNGAASFAPPPASAADNCSGVTVAAPRAGSFPLGKTPLLYTALDAAGQEALCSSSVTVVDRTAPDIAAVAASPSVLWPVNHRMVNVSVSASVLDSCRGTAGNSCHITSVTSNERGSGDWTITGPLTLQLRAERSGSRSGRLYTIGVECRDADGNTSTSSTQVLVPHSIGET